MNKNKIFTIILTLNLLFLASLSRAQNITEISVEGNQYIDSFYLKKISGLKVGEELTAKKVSKAIQNIYRRGQFKDVIIKGKEQEEGVHVLIQVQERPIIEGIEVKGMDKIDATDIWREIPLQKGLSLNLSDIKKSKQNIIDLYKGKGYLLAEVEVEVLTLEDSNRVKLIYEIKEGKKVRIKKIRFSNNKAFSDKKLRGKMEDTKEDRWWNTSEFNQEKFEGDLDRIIDFYRENGYVDAEIVDYDIKYLGEDKNMHINITVNEGQVYYVDRIEFDGNEIFTSLELAKLLKFEEKEIYNQKKVEKTLEEIYNVYAERGYIFSNIYPDVEIDEKYIDITYKITENEQAHVNEVVILGNTKTHENVIRRQISIYPGDVFRRSRIMRTQRDLLHLGYFDETQFNFDIRPVNTGDEGDVDLIFDLTEKRTGNISLGAGYSSQDKLTGFLEVAENNFLGRGQRLNLRWQFGKTRQDYELGFTEPWLFGTPTSVGANLFKTTRDRGNYDEKNAGASLQLGRPLPWLDYSRIYLRYTLEDVDIDLDDNYKPTSSYDLREWDGPRRTSSFKLTLSRDSSNDLYCPTAGSNSSIVMEYAGGDLLGGDVKYQKYIVNSEWYFPGFWKFALSVGFRAGLVDGFNSPDEVPIYERFELGGMIYNRVRGYPDYEIVPEGNSYREGGRSMFILTSEYKVPIVPNQVYFLTFAEAGNTWNNLRESDLSNLKRSVGLGLRVITPMGPLGFDYAYGLDRKDGGDWEPHFVFGSFF